MIFFLISACSFLMVVLLVFFGGGEGGRGEEISVKFSLQIFTVNYYNFFNFKEEAMILFKISLSFPLNKSLNCMLIYRLFWMHSFYIFTE